MERIRDLGTNLLLVHPIFKHQVFESVKMGAQDRNACHMFLVAVLVLKFSLKLRFPKSKSIVLSRFAITFPILLAIFQLRTDQRLFFGCISLKAYQQQRHLLMFWNESFFWAIGVGDPKIWRGCPTPPASYAYVQSLVCNYINWPEEGISEFS